MQGYQRTWDLGAVCNEPAKAVHDFIRLLRRATALAGWKFQNPGQSVDRWIDTLVQNSPDPKTAFLQGCVHRSADFWSAFIVEQTDLRDLAAKDALEKVQQEFEAMAAGNREIFAGRVKTPNVPEWDAHSAQVARSVWLKSQMEKKSWTSLRQITDAGGPAYNTIRRFESGTRSTRDTSVRADLAKAFQCQLSDVPQ